jgi:prolycopene isomerase
MHYDTIVIGAGLSGLAAAALLSKRGLKVACIDNNYHPGGSCGTFKRRGATFDQGSSMLYGFGERGFNPHRFVFNCLEEPIDMIRHEMLYVVEYDGKRIRFYDDLERFIVELGSVFPEDKDSIRRFYRHIETIYQHVMVETPSYTTPDETNPREALLSVLKHPLSYVRFLSYLNQSAKTLLKRFFKNEAIYSFFDKMTSTYSYTTVEETPAVLAAIMFVDNHFGGSYYPAGSTVFLPGKLEKVIEEHGGEMIYETKVEEILFVKNKPSGVRLDNGQILEADDIVYSGTVWNLYDKLLGEHASPRRQAWAKALEPTYPSVMIYTLVDAAVVDDQAQPIELLVGNPHELDESEVTVYIPSLDDRTICPAGTHVVMAIGPSLSPWNPADRAGYALQKKAETKRLLAVLDRRYPGLSKAVRYTEIATPKTIERYTMKPNGTVAGPKQKIGQHMFLRLHTRSEWKNIFYCGESTALGTGTPAVTVSGLAAANAIMRKRGLKPFVYRPNQPNFVRILPRPFLPEHRYISETPEARTAMLAASRCLDCARPTCSASNTFDVRGMNRRLTVQNIFGAKKIAATLPVDLEVRNQLLAQAEQNCILNKTEQQPVAIKAIVDFLMTR